MNDKVNELEELCRGTLQDIQERLSGKIDYGLEDWFSRLRNFEEEDCLNALIAYQQTRYPALICNKLLKQVRLRGLDSEQFRYTSRLNSQLKRLLSLYPRINAATKRLYP